MSETYNANNAANNWTASALYVLHKTPVLIDVTSAYNGIDHTEFANDYFLDAVVRLTEAERRQVVRQILRDLLSETSHHHTPLTVLYRCIFSRETEFHS